MTWAAVSLADKLDTIVGLTMAGEKRDRLARSVRRCAAQMHGIVRILMDLPELVGIDREVGLRGARRAGGAGDSACGRRRGRAGAWSPSRRSGCASCSSIAACRARCVRARRRRPATSIPLRARRGREALQALRTSADFQALAALFKRVKNIAKELTGARRARPRRR